MAGLIILLGLAAAIMPGWTTGETYSFDAAEYGSYRYLYLSAEVDGEDFGLVNIFEQLSEEQKSKNPQNRFFDA